MSEPAIHGPRSPRWSGNPRQYQIEAQTRWCVKNDRGLLPWAWITTECEVDQCLDTSCMVVHQPVRLGYRRGTCVYCGEGSTGVDHLLPAPWTGATQRHMVAVVPACANCNQRIGDELSPNVSVRRKRAQLSIERHNKQLLLRPAKTLDDLCELGPLLRSVAETNNAKAERVRARLAWPIDPYYDLRAFQKVGIEDPISLGLCDLESTPLRPEYQEEAA